MESSEHFDGGFYSGGYLHCATEPNAGGGGGRGAADQFLVEDLLDFSNEEEDEAEELATGGDDNAAGNSTDSSTVTAVDSCSNSSSSLEPNFSSDLVCRSLADASLSGDLCEPYDELAELEWLSAFVEESFSSENLHKLHLTSGINRSSSSTSVAAANRAEVSAPAPAAGRSVQVAPFHNEAPVPGKARSKRSRAAPCSWSSRLLVLSPSLSAASSPESELILLPGASGVGVKKAAKPAAKKRDPAAAPDGRRCLHCQTDKTPQWRTGPMGPKTLCNACGVRYKSGRLVPEYRPAASPTFVVSEHSNSHRKVLELRHQKGLQLLHSGGGGALYDGPPPPMFATSDDYSIHSFYF